MTNGLEAWFRSTPGRVAAAAATKHVLRGGEQIAQLLLGTDEPEETIDAGRMKTAGDAAQLASVLFPNQHPTLGMWDHY